MAKIAQTVWPTAAKVTLWGPSLALSLAALFWSGNFIAGRALRGQIDPITLNFSRWALALLIIAPFVWRDAIASFTALRREWRRIVLLGATGIAAFHTCVYFALQCTTAISALLILSLTPIATLVGAATLGLERPTRRQLVGALISIVGAAVLITMRHIPATTTMGLNGGDLLMMVAVVIWTAYSLLLKSASTIAPAPVTLGASIAVALALMAPVMIFSAPADLTRFSSPTVLLSIGYIALFASALGFLFWSYGVSRLGPARAGQYVQLMPVFGAALSFALLGETFTWAQVAGAALVLAGIMNVEHRANGQSSSGDPGGKQ